MKGVSIAIVISPEMEKNNQKAVLLTNLTNEQVGRLLVVICDWVEKENLR